MLVDAVIAPPKVLSAGFLGKKMRQGFQGPAWRSSIIVTKDAV
jgi:hypothetical protein